MKITIKNIGALLIGIFACAYAMRAADETILGQAKNLKPSKNTYVSSACSPHNCALCWNCTFAHEYTYNCHDVTFVSNCSPSQVTTHSDGHCNCVCDCKST